MTYNFQVIIKLQLIIILLIQLPSMAPVNVSFQKIKLLVSRKYLILEYFLVVLATFRVNNLNTFLLPLNYKYNVHPCITTSCRNIFRLSGIQGKDWATNLTWKKAIWAERFSRKMLFWFKTINLSITFDFTFKQYQKITILWT